MGPLETVAAAVLVALTAVAPPAQTAERQKTLSDGIAEAMYNTAYGLSIALICMIAHMLLSAAQKKVVSDLEAFSLRFENLLAEGGAAGQAQRAPGADDSLDKDQVG